MYRIRIGVWLQVLILRDKITWPPFNVSAETYEKELKPWMDIVNGSRNKLLGIGVTAFATAEEIKERA